MTIYALDGLAPRIAEDSWIAPDANVIGNVTLEEGGSIWFGCTLRGDNEPIVIGAGSNVQENTVMHTDPGCPLTIGAGCTIGHKAMLHGCTVGDGSLIGMNAVILNHAVIGKNCLIGANALVTEGTVVPDGSLVLGSPAKVIKLLSEAAIKQMHLATQTYIDKIDLYNQELIVL